MGQISPYLRKVVDGYAHYCPACSELHTIYVRDSSPSWTFNGDLYKPTFSPSVKITGVQTEKINGEWTGEFILGPGDKPLRLCCHYHLEDGLLKYCSDCTHEYSGKTIPLPVLPSWASDDE